MSTSQKPTESYGNFSISQIVEGIDAFTVIVGFVGVLIGVMTTLWVHVYKKPVSAAIAEARRAKVIDELPDLLRELRKNAEESYGILQEQNSRLDARLSDFQDNSLQLQKLISGIQTALSEKNTQIDTKLGQQQANIVLIEKELAGIWDTVKDVQALVLKFIFQVKTLRPDEIFTRAEDAMEIAKSLDIHFDQVEEHFKKIESNRDLRQRS